MNIDEFKEALFRLSLLGQEKINDFIGSGAGYDADVFEGLFKWMDIPDTPQGTLEKIKRLKDSPTRSRWNVNDYADT